DHRPGGRQATVQRHPVEDLDLGTTPDGQSLDDVKAIQLRTGLGQVRQVPTPRRRRAANPAATIPGSTPFQDAVDGAYRGNLCESLFLQSLLDGVSPVGPQVAVLTELATQMQHLFLQFGGRAVGWVGTPGTVFPVHPVEALTLGPFDPVDHGADTHAKAASHGTAGLVLTNSRHHLATSLGGTVCLLMVLSSGRLVFQIL